MMALLLIISLPVTILAESWYLENGDITVNAGESGQTVTQGEQKDIPDLAPVITQSGGDSTPNTVTINAAPGATANVTLSGVNIDASKESGVNIDASGDSGKAAIQTGGEGKVVIELDGNNTVQGGDGHAGV